MSSADNLRPCLPATAPKPYFCYECDRTVSVSLPTPSSDLTCPNCHGGFLEESQYPPAPNSSFDDPFSAFGFPFFFPDSAHAGFDPPLDLSNLLGPLFRHARSPSDNPAAFDPMVFLQNHLQELMEGGANVQFVIDGAPSGASLSAGLGDYFVGPGLELLIQQLAENDPNRYGTPPASKSAVESLPDVKISPELMQSDSSQCAVCMDHFELGLDAKQMPCKHIFHPDCILPWLELHNSCPVCRFELPTDDPDYESRMREALRASNPTDGNANTASVNSGEAAAAAAAQADAQRTVERRFRVSLPWPFRVPGSSSGSGASTTDSGRDDNSNDHGRDMNSSSGNQDNMDIGSETRQDELD